MHRIKLFFRKQIVTRCLLAQGWALFALKRFSGAQRVLERGVTLAPASFRMHLLLGRIHLARGQGGKALQELSICYHLDPASFTRSSFEGDLRDEVEFRTETESDRDLFELPLREDGPLAGEWDDLLGSYEEEEAEEILMGTDFSSISEFRRFQELAPLTAAEIEDTDLDSLMDRLSSTSTYGESLDQG